MGKLFRRILFYLLGIVYLPLTLFSHLTYPWWQELSKGSFGKKILYFALAPVYGPLTFFLYLTYKSWTNLHAK